MNRNRSRVTKQTQPKFCSEEPVNNRKEGFEKRVKGLMHVQINTFRSTQNEKAT